jgi:hypothetical protein
VEVAGSNPVIRSTSAAARVADGTTDRSGFAVQRPRVIERHIGRGEDPTPSAPNVFHDGAALKDAPGLFVQRGQHDRDAAPLEPFDEVPEARRTGTRVRFMGDNP